MARTEATWLERDGTYVEVADQDGLDVLIKGTSKYLNFDTLSGETGYGFRDNVGVMEFKNSGGSWNGVISIGDITLEAVSNASTTLGKSTYLMTEGIGVIFVTSSASGSVTSWNIDESNGSVGFDNVLIDSLKGIGYGIGTDENMVLMSIDATGNPTLVWDDDGQRYVFNKNVFSFQTLTAQDARPFELNNGFFLEIDATANISGDNYIGLAGAATWISSFDLAASGFGLIGTAGVYTHDGLGEVSDATAMFGLIGFDQAGSVVEANVFNSLFTTDAAASITNGYLYNGLIDNSGGATITNFYGLNIPDVTLASNNWAIKTGAGLNSFGDSLEITTGTLTHTNTISSFVTSTDVEPNMLSQTFDLDIALADSNLFGYSMAIGVSSDAAEDITGSSVVAGLDLSVTCNTTGDLVDVIGLRPSVIHVGAGTIDLAAGVGGAFVSAGAGTTTNATAFLANLLNFGGTVTNAYAFYAPAGSVTGASAGSSWGIHVADISQNYLEGSLGLGVAVPTEKLHVVGNLLQANKTTVDTGSTTYSPNTFTQNFDLTTTVLSSPTIGYTFTSDFTSDVGEDYDASSIGLTGLALARNAGVGGASIGIVGSASFIGAGASATGIGVSSSLTGSAGTQTVWAGYSLAMVNTGATVGTAFGIWIPATAVSGVGATSAWVIHSADTSPSYLQGDLGIGIAVPTAKLHVEGSVAFPYILKTANYTITAADYTIDCTGTHTQTLPTAVGIKGTMYAIINSGNGIITLAGDGAETIGNGTGGTPVAANTLTLNPGDVYNVQSDNANWKLHA